MQSKKAAKALASVGFALIAFELLFTAIETLILTVLDILGVNMNFLLTDKGDILMTLVSYLCVMLPTVMLAKKCVSAECGEDAFSAMLPCERVGAGKFALCVLTCYAFSFAGNIISQRIVDFAAANSLPVPSANTEVYSSPFLFLIQILVIAVIPALLEELLTRGMVCYYCSHLGSACCGVASGLFFALFHNNFAQYPTAFLFGFITGYFVCEYKNIWIGVTAHLLNNAVSLLIGFCPEQYKTAAAAAVAVVIAVSITAFVIMLTKYSLFRHSAGADSGKQLGRLFTVPLFDLYVAASVIIAVFKLVM